MLKFLVPILLLLLICLPILPIYKGLVKGKKAKKLLVFNLVSFFAVCAIFAVSPAFGAFAAAADTAVAAADSGLAAGLGYIAAGLVTGLACLGCGIAVSSSASAAIGAISEDSSLLGRALIFVALGEGIALYGILISILILNKI